MIDESFSNSNENNKKNTDHEIIDKTGVDPIDETEEVSPIEQTEEGLSKECPICAETVQAKAKICRFCTHEFETEEVSPIEQTEEGLSKECPICAETVQAKAKICRFCTHEFETEEVSPIEQTEEGLSKECPICAETVQAKAKICRFCTHEFETEEVSPIEQTEEGLSKECPICAETVQAKAKICRFCTHEFETEEVSPIEQTEEGLLIKCPHCAEYIKKEAIKCKHCGESLETSDGQYDQWTPGFMFDGLVDAFEENLELQVKEDASWLLTQVGIGESSMQIVQSKGLEGLEHLESETFPGITLCLPLEPRSVELSRFKEFDEFNLFSQYEDAGFVNFYIDLGSDTEGAAILVSKIFLNCFGVSKSDPVECVTDDFGQPAISPSTINTESIQNDAFTMKPAADANKPIKIQKKKKSKFKIFLWLLLGAIIYLYFSGQ